MKKYTIIGGVNGTGKSSFTGVLKSSVTDLGLIIDVDQLTASIGGNALEGGKLALRRIQECLDKGVCFTQESTLSGGFISKTAKRALDLGYQVRLYYIGLDSVEESLLRIENRVRRGGHDIPEEVVLRRFQDRFQALTAVLPYCTEAAFYDNDNGFREVAVYRNGELLLLGEHWPKWILEFRDYLNA